MRRMMIVLALLLAAPLSAQSVEPASSADAWRRMPVPDARLRVERAAAPVGERGAPVWRPGSSVQWMLLGAAVGCVGGALLMGSGADEGEVAAQRFDGCVLGGSAGMFLGGAYGLLTGG
ncbi:MAG TPA: hypothetical protein VFT45_00230 [Longimicrobium sp.]|nr:hypothetical protein [Longimicrobium sp.]